MDKVFKDQLLNLHILKLVGDIDESTLRYFQEALQIAEKEKIKKLTLEIASFGGNKNVSHKIFDLLSNFPGKITGVVMPFADSGGAIILQACHKRLSIQTGTLVFHHARGGNYELSTYHRSKQIDMETEKDWNRLVTRRSKISSSEFNKLMDLDIRISAQQALRLGLIDGIIKTTKKKKKKSKAKASELLITDINGSSIAEILGFLDALRPDYPPLTLKLQPGRVQTRLVINLYEILKSYPGKLTVIACKDLGNITPLLLLVADERKSYLTVKFKFDEPFMRMDYMDKINPRSEKLLLERLKYMNTFVLTEFLRFSKITKAKYEQLIKQPKSNWFDAKTAKKFGIMDKIIIPSHFR